MSTSRRSARTPLACSMTHPAVQRGLQLVGDDAPPGAARGSAGARWWRRRRGPGRPAMSAASRPGASLKRFSAPMTSRRSRIGSAWTAPNPRSWACSANRGQRLLAASRLGHAHRLPAAEAVEARALVVLELEQLEQADLLARSGHDAELPAGVGEQHPGGGHVQQLGAPRGEQVQELDDVELVHQAVGQLDEGGGETLGVHRPHSRPCRLSRSKRRCRRTTSRATSERLRSWA